MPGAADLWRKQVISRRSRSSSRAIAPVLTAMSARNRRGDFCRRQAAERDLQFIPIERLELAINRRPKAQIDIVQKIVASRPWAAIEPSMRREWA
jgi:hypothetical protein